jgi:hypothetical protein
MIMKLKKRPGPNRGCRATKEEEEEEERKDKFHVEVT